MIDVDVMENLDFEGVNDAIEQKIKEFGLVPLCQHNLIPAVGNSKWRYPELKNLIQDKTPYFSPERKTVFMMYMATYTPLFGFMEFIDYKMYKATLKDCKEKDINFF